MPPHLGGSAFRSRSVGFIKLEPSTTTDDANKPATLSKRVPSLPSATATKPSANLKKTDRPTDVKVGSLRFPAVPGQNTAVDAVVLDVMSKTTLSSSSSSSSSSSAATTLRRRSPRGGDAATPSAAAAGDDAVPPGGPPTKRASPLPLSLCNPRLGSAATRFFLMRPLSRSQGVVQCRFTNHGGNNWECRIAGGDVLMSAKRRRMSLSPSVDIFMPPVSTAVATTTSSRRNVKKKNELLGRLKGNFCCDTFSASSKEPAGAGESRAMAEILYEPDPNPRKMTAWIPKTFADAEGNATRLDLGEKPSLTLAAMAKADNRRLKSKVAHFDRIYVESADATPAQQTARDMTTRLCLRKPVWDRELGAYVADFGDRADLPSACNCQLYVPYDSASIKTSLLLGKVAQSNSQDEFNMDIAYPMSYFQAFAICISACLARESSG